MLVYGAKDLILTGYIDSDFHTDKDSKNLHEDQCLLLMKGL